jgi:hypothetical protein
VIDPVAAYNAYSAAWNQKDDPEARDRLLDQSWAPDGVLYDEESPEGVVGREALSAYIARTHEDMPGLAISNSSEPQVLANRLRVNWIAMQGDIQVFTGTDFLEFSDDGRVSRLTMFYDPTPGA